MTKQLKTLISYVPRALPVGMSQFDAWAKRIIDVSGKFADEDSMKFALASQILHLPSNTSKISDQYFIRALRKAAANQVASQAFQDIKNKQIEAAKLAEQKQVEATTPPQEAVPSNEQPNAQN